MKRNLIVLPDGTEICSGTGTVNAIQRLTVTECVNSGTELTVGSVCCSSLEATIITPDGALALTAGTDVALYKVDDEGNRTKVGVFRLEKPTRPSANILKITAYDWVSQLDKDLSDWLLSLNEWPYTVSDFAKMVCAACGLQGNEANFDTLPNGDYEIQKFAVSVTGRQLMEWVGQIAGRFCRADKDGYIEFAWYSDAEVSIGGTGSYYFGSSLSFEDYAVAPVEKVQIRLTEEDVGVVAPDGDTTEKNTYIITGNYLLSGSTTEAIKPIAEILQELLSQVSYTPLKVTVPQGTDIHAGQILQVTDRNGKQMTTYVMTAVRSGQKIELESTGSHRRDSTTVVNNESVKDLKGRILSIQKSAEALRVENKDLDGRCSALEMQIGSITMEVVNDQTGAAASIKISSGEKVLVDSAAVRKAFADDPSEVAISAGTVTFNSGTLTINSDYFKVDATGKITATSGTVGAITLTGTGIYSYNVSYSASYAGWYRPATVYTSSVCFFAGATSQTGADASFEVTYGGALTATGANITGKITTEDGSDKTVLTGGKLSLYYNSVRYGFLSAMNWGGTDAPKGLTLCCTYKAKFFSLGYDEDGNESYAGKYVINLGANPSGYTERHHFYDDVRFRGYAVLPKTPTDDSHVTNKAYVDDMASQTVGRARNRNLLDNWYFPNAVNQRGSNLYKSKGFTVDRWKLQLWQSSGAYAYPNSSDMTIHNETAQGTACSCYLEQTIDNPSKLAGKTVTLSAKLRGVTVAGDPILRIYTDTDVFKSGYITSDDANSIVTLTATLPDDMTTLAVGIGAYASYGGDGNFNIAIESMKLELGAVSTLAYDQPPKYSEQLLECQRYFIRYSNTGALQAFTGGANGTAVYAAVQLPTAMRGTDAPTVSYSGLDIYNFVSGGSVAVKSCGGNMLASRNDIVLWATYTATDACPSQTPASIRIGAGGYIDISCDI